MIEDVSEALFLRHHIGNACQSILNISSIHNKCGDIETGDILIKAVERIMWALQEHENIMFNL